MNLGYLVRFFDSCAYSRLRTAPYSSAAPAIFMHIPKACGSALASGLTGALAPRKAICQASDRVLFGSFHDFDSMGPPVRGSIYLDSASLPADADFVSGHISFGTLRQRYADGQHITFLREPISRILSHFLYWRSMSEEELRPWGGWRERVKKSRGPLFDFLSCRNLASTHDNLYVRMLLWPHPLISDDNFLEERNDKVLIREAMAKLKQFAYLDVVENPKLVVDLENWLGRPFPYNLVNETTRIPEPFRTPWHKELKPEVLDLLEQRTRLDLQLWRAVARQRIAPSSLESLRMRTAMLNAARHSWLVAPDSAAAKQISKTAP